MFFAESIALLVATVILIWVGRPDAEGESPRWMRFFGGGEFYALIPLVTLVLGAAGVISTVFG